MHSKGKKEPNLVETALGRRSVPCCSSDAITNQKELRSVKVSLEGSSSSALSIWVPIDRIGLPVWPLNSVS